MALPLLRVDDRLIHGQVLIGWGRPLAARFVVLVDDEVRHSEWEQNLYRMAVPPDIELIIADTREAVEQLPRWLDDPRPGILVTAVIATMTALHDAVPRVVQRVNLGGRHHRPGKTQRLRYIFLGDAEESLLRRLAAEGVRISAQDLPTAAPVSLEALLP